jgi:hypothetical protein
MREGSGDFFFVMWGDEGMVFYPSLPSSSSVGFEGGGGKAVVDASGQRHPFWVKRCRMWVGTYNDSATMTLLTDHTPLHTAHSTKHTAQSTQHTHSRPYPSMRP